MKRLKYIRNKAMIIKKILLLDTRYDSDYLMRWTKKDLLDHYNSLIIKLSKKNKAEGKEDDR